MSAPGPELDWSRWSVVLLKPDCVQRGLVDQVLDRVRAELCLVAVEDVTVTDWQIFTHYWDLFVHRHQLDVDVADCIRRRYVGQHAVIALGHDPDYPTHDHIAPSTTSGSAGPAAESTAGLSDARLDTTARVRALLGHFDPFRARPGTIRADFGTDSLTAARAQSRLVDNLIHSSDDPTASWRDFHIWFGGHRASELLTPHDPATCPTSTTPAAGPSADQHPRLPHLDPTEVSDT